MKQFINVDEYIAQADENVRSTLDALRKCILKAAPDATESISYGMPFYEYGGKGYKGRLVYFGAFKNHISIFIPTSLTDYPDELLKYQKSKATFHFSLKEPLPFDLISDSVKAIVRERDQIKQ